MTPNSRTDFDLRLCVPMSRTEETRCAIEYVKTREPRLAERLITANMRLVVKIARDYRRENHDMRDLIQEGNLGLLQAVLRFDPDRGVKLCSYAAWWIRAYILKFVMDNWRLVKTGTTQAQRRLFFSLHREQHRLQRSGVEADTKQLAAALDVKETEVVSMMQRFGASEISLDSPKYSGASGSTARDEWLGAAPELRPDVMVETSQFIRNVRTKVDVFGSTLHGRDRIIFQARFLDEDPSTLSHLAIGFGVSRERTRQLESRLKTRLRNYLRLQLGDAVLGRGLDQAPANRPIHESQAVAA